MANRTSSTISDDQRIQSSIVSSAVVFTLPATRTEVSDQLTPALIVQWTLYSTGVALARTLVHEIDSLIVALANRSAFGIIDNDGIHPPAVVTGAAKLAEGVHRIRVSYFQGLRYDVALILKVSEPNQDSWRIFNTNDYRPPAEEFDSGGLEQEGKPQGNRHRPR
jgi:hypothetical protein